MIRVVVCDGNGNGTSKFPHEEPYMINPYVRFDEMHPPKNGEVRFEGKRRPRGRSR